MICASFLTDPLTLTWKKLAEAAAMRIACAEFDRLEFVQALRDCRGLSRLAPQEFFPQLTAKCAAAGVAVVLVPELKGQSASCAHGALDPRHGYIAVSLRYRREDRFWFSFYHAAAHLIQSEENPGDAAACAEASRVAADLLIPPPAAAALSGLLTAPQIEDFARSIEVAPGIVVGRMQFERLIPYSQFNPLNRKLDFTLAPGAQEAAAATWLSVREAALALMRDLPHLNMAQANVMVSRAATRGDIQTNGAAYQKRRLHPTSLAAWRLEQRDRDLDKEDQEEAA